jgi:putative cell wall-binding protein
LKTRTSRRPRAALALAAAVAVGLSTFAALPAAAAESAVDDAVFTWGINNESNSGAFFGGCNFLSAGIAGNTGSSRVWTEADGFYDTEAGNVEIIKPTATGDGVTNPSWATKCKTPAGATVNISATSWSSTQVQISNGTGSVDPTTGEASIQWDGDFTVAYYGGLTYWSASDPLLTVDADGTGTVTATASGYGADMVNTELWNTLTPRTITLATLTNVDVTEDGFTATPEYVGVSAPEGSTQAAQSAANAAYWGSFPGDFVDFQVETGQSSYWYSSGLAADVKKPALPITIAYTVPAPIPTPTVVVSKTSNVDPLGEVVTVTGTGFLPSGAATTGTRPPLAGKFTGVYVGFGKYAEVWQPTASAAPSARSNSDVKWAVSAEDMATIGGPGAGAIEVKPDGSFETTLLVKNNYAGAPATGNYGIYTYPGGGAKYAPFETYTPIDFAPVSRIQGATRYDVAVGISQKAYPSTASTVYVVTGENYPDALSAAPAAVKENAPLLLTPKSSIPASVTTEIQRLKPSKIVVVGGPNSVSDAVLSQLDALATGDAVRVSGADRYEASRNVVDYAFGADGATLAYVSTGQNFPDALSASAAGGKAGAPVVLVNGTAAVADAATKTTLSDLGVTSVKIAGGPNSVTRSIEASLVSDDRTVTRLSGADRFEASANINKDAFTSSKRAFIATGYNFPDALAGAAYAGAVGAPLYVVPTTCVPAQVLADLTTLGVDQVTLLGGPNSLTAAVEELTACG